MMEVQNYSGINDAIYYTLKNLRSQGTSRCSRNGDAIFLNNYQFSLSDIHDRFISLPGRTYNIYASLMELLWVFAGKEDITGIFSHFLPRAPLYSDDGKKWRGAYGPRLFKSPKYIEDRPGFSHYSAMSEAISYLLDDPYTRQSCFNVWGYDRDSKAVIYNDYHTEKSKDIPCTSFGWFWVDSEDKLNLKVHMRSNDVIYGLSHINILEFTSLLELAHLIVSAQHPHIKLGHYYHNVINIHYYKNVEAQVDKILDNEAPSRRPKPVDYQLFYPGRCTDGEKVLVGSYMVELASSIASTYYDVINAYYLGEVPYGKAVETIINYGDKIGTQSLFHIAGCLVLAYLGIQEETDSLFDFNKEDTISLLKSFSLTKGSSLHQALMNCSKTTDLIKQTINN